MNISMSIGFGIQKNIKEKFSSNTGDLIITNYNNNLFETLASIETDLIDFSNLQKTAPGPQNFNHWAPKGRMILPFWWIF